MCVVCVFVCALITTGVTRESIIQLARKLGYEVLEEPVSVHEAMEADEIFTTGAPRPRPLLRRSTVPLTVQQQAVRAWTRKQTPSVQQCLDVISDSLARTSMWISSTCAPRPCAVAGQALQVPAGVRTTTAHQP